MLVLALSTSGKRNPSCAGIGMSCGGGFPWVTGGMGWGFPVPPLLVCAPLVVCLLSVFLQVSLGAQLLPLSRWFVGVVPLFLFLFWCASGVPLVCLWALGLCPPWWF